MNTRKGLLLAAAVALLFLVIALRELGTLRDRAEDARRPPEGSAGPADLGALAPDRADAPAAAASRASALPTPGAGPRGAPLGTTPFEVRVVRAGTHTPVAGAELSCWPRSTPPDGRDDLTAWILAGRVEANRSTAETAISDGDGRARLPRGSQGASVVASTDGLWGSAYFGPVIEGEARVELHPDADLHVQVVAADGTPVAGVGVALSERRGVARFDQVRATTAAPDGLAVLRHASARIHGLPAGGALHVVRVLGLFDPPLELPVGSFRPAGEPLRIVLRPYGACSIVAESADGVRVSGPLAVELGFAPRADVMGAAGPSAPRSDTPTVFGNGSVPIEFDCVELGRQLYAIVRRAGSDAEWVAEGAGPSASLPRVELRARPTRELAVLRGRVVEDSGAPLGLRSLRASFEHLDGDANSSAARSIETGSDGRFELEMNPLGAVPDGAELVLALASGREVRGAIGRRALPAELRTGPNELGDVVLSAAPPVATGTVVDEADRPIAGASITPIEAETERPTRGEDLVVRPDPSGRIPGVESDAAGRFELYGEPGSGTLWLRANKTDLAGDPVRVRSAIEPVRLVLGRAGSIAGTVLVAPALSDTLLLVEAVRAPAAGEPNALDETPAAVLGRDGGFTCGGLRPGTYTLRVLYAPTATELARIERIDVRSGTVTRDARLAPLDLSGKFGCIELELFDALGRPVAGGRASSRPSGDTDRPWTHARNSGARLSILSDGRPLDVAIDAEGFVSVQLTRVAGSRRVALERAAKLRFELPRGLPLPAHDLCLAVQVEGTMPRGAPLPSRRVRAAFGPGRSAECECPFNGDVRVQLLVESTDLGVAPVLVREARPTVVHVAPHDLEQVFVLSVDRERLAEAIEEARNPH